MPGVDLGPVVAGVLAEFAPAPLVVPYLAHLPPVLCAASARLAERTAAPVGLRIATGSLVLLPAGAVAPVAAVALVVLLRRDDRAVS